MKLIFNPYYDQAVFSGKDEGCSMGCKYVGPNLLGRLLMELRDNGKLEYNLPDDALDFIEILKK